MDMDTETGTAGTAGGLGQGALARRAGFRGIDACVAATGPYGYVTGYVCI